MDSNFRSPGYESAHYPSSLNDLISLAISVCSTWTILVNTNSMGAYRTDRDTGDEQEFGVASLIMHPYYHSPRRYAHDIALLQLDRPAVLNR